MTRRRPTHLLVSALLLSASTAVSAQVFVVGMKTATQDVVTEFHATHVELPQQPLDQRGRLDLIRNLEAEQGFAHRELPAGAGLLLVANGNMEPRDEAYKRMLYEKGQASGPGERVEITALQFKPDRIVIDFNGGPYAKHRFLSHIQINDIQLAPTGAPSTGFRITLLFEGGVPAVSAAEVKALLDPMVDFKARSSVEAYTNTLAPPVKLAVESHDILVGMDRQMVLASVGAPISRHREHVTKEGTASTDPEAPTYEEWIYGQTPDPIRFVRFRNGQVVRLEIAALGKPIEVHDKNEMGTAAAPALLARTISNGDEQRDPAGDQHAAHPPTLRLPGEVIEGTSTVGKVNMPADPPKPTSPTTPQP
jgi:hypothetical protein